MLEWEQGAIDRIVADLFGFHALQIGWPALDGLRANRMPHRWLMTDGTEASYERAHATQGRNEDDSVSSGSRPDLLSDYDALPYPANSLDLVVLPHTLEQSTDAHQTLREVERVLVSEGRVVVLGFNPVSLWGLHHLVGETAQGLGLGRRPAAAPWPWEGELIGPRRLRDWLRLLGFEVERTYFGCYRPPVRSRTWLDRYAWMEGVGEHGWPVMGSVYATVAVKRVRGMRLIGLDRKKALGRKGARSPAVATRGTTLSCPIVPGPSEPPISHRP